MAGCEIEADADALKQRLLAAPAVADLNVPERLGSV